MSLAGGAADDDDATLPVRVRFTPGSIVRAVLIVMVFVIVAQVIGAASNPIVWFAEGVAGAAIFYPIVFLLSKKMPHALAVALVSVLLVVFVGFLGFRLFTELKGEAEEFQQRAPTIGQNLESSSSAAKQFGLGEKINRFADDVSGAFSFEGADVTTISTAASIGSSLFVVWLFGVMMLFSAPTFLKGAGNQITDDERKERLGRVASGAYVNAWEYFALTALRALAYGLVTWIAAWEIGFATPTLLAVWVTLWAFVPRVGLIVGGALVGILAMFTTFVGAGIMFAAYVVAQGFDVHFVQRRIDRQTVHLGPSLTMIAATIGFGLYGFGGTIVFFVATIFGVAVLDQLRPDADALPADESGVIASNPAAELVGASDPATATT